MAFWRSKKAADERRVAADTATRRRCSVARKKRRRGLDPAEPAEGGCWRKMRGALSKTRQTLNTDIRDLFKSEGRLVDDEFLGELFARLIRTDMGVGPAEAIRDDVGTRLASPSRPPRRGPGNDHRTNAGRCSSKKSAGIRFAESGPTVILVVGVNGSGKTTSIGKLARSPAQVGTQGRARCGRHVSCRGRRTADRLGRPNRLRHRDRQTRSRSGQRRLSNRRAGAREPDADVAIIDTAGRLQTQTNLMQQLEKIRRVVEKKIEGSASRGAVGAGRHRRPECDQPGTRVQRGGRMHGDRAGQTRWFGQGRRDLADSRAVPIAGQVRRARRGNRRHCRVRCRLHSPKHSLPSRPVTESARPCSTCNRNRPLVGSSRSTSTWTKS